MVANNETSFQNNPTQQPNPRTLLRKYEIPIDQLSFEYIGTCNDIKKLERIVRILRSGEEGYFPDLQRTAEDRLRQLSPNSRQLRDEKPVLTCANMSKEEWANIASDLENWKMEVAMKDLKLREEDSNSDEVSYLPPVRQRLADKDSDKNGTSNQTSSVKKPAVSSYATWDKYDPDVEILKMDLEEEKAAKKKKNDSMKSAQPVPIEARLEEVRLQAEALSKTERKLLAGQKKDQGNEFYRAKDFLEAVKLYSESIELWPTTNAFNNRAECNLKLGKYADALDDANSTLRAERNNVKARFRRGLAYKHLNKIAEAIEDMNSVLQLEPNNKSASALLKELNLKLQSMQRSDRILDGWEPSKQRIFEMCQSAMRHNRTPQSHYDLNRFGLLNDMPSGSGRRHPGSMDGAGPSHCDMNRFRSARDMPGGSGVRQPPRQSTCSAPIRQDPPSLSTKPKPKIVEIIDEVEVSKTKNSTRMPIIEVNKLEQVGSETTERKNAVIDKRTKIPPASETNPINGV